MTEPEDLATIQEYLTLPYGQIGYNTNTMIPGKLTGFPHNHGFGSLHGPVVPTTLSPQHGFGGLDQGDGLLYHAMETFKILARFGRTARHKRCADSRVSVSILATNWLPR